MSYRLLSLVVLGAFFCSACTINPVTGKKELSLVSPQQEVNIGQQQYVPARQMQGGDYILDPALTNYVNDVGQRVAAHSGRAGLPFEFVILNSSTPNAWALPGGKIAINRGLLLELNSEAELAAVLGHEAIHAAARHSAKSIERNMLMQAALMGVQASTDDNQYANLIVGGAQVGAGLITQKYGRDAELESDRYGIDAMKAAGYNPQAAVELQRTFVRLSEDQRSDWLSGLFASHPPSQTRVQKNQAYVQQIGATGEFHKARYQQFLATLKQQQPAYENYDKAIKQARSGNRQQAIQLARQATQQLPEEAKFHSLLGDLSLDQQEYEKAIGYYDKAVARNANYFQPLLGRGMARQKLGDLRGAEADFERANQLLPTATAHHGLGYIALNNNDERSALEHFKAAADARQTSIGQDAFKQVASIEIKTNPNQYLISRMDLDARRRPVVIIQNRSPVAINNLMIELITLAPTGNASASQRTRLNGVIRPNEQIQVATGLPSLRGNDPLNMRVRIISAQVEQ